MNLSIPSKVVLAFFMTLGFAACTTVGPDHVSPKMDIPTVWSRIEITDRLVTHDAPCEDLARWWTRLNDPLLSELVDDALRASPDIRTAQARLREARARRSTAAAQLFPSVSASGTATRSESSEETGGGAVRELYSTGFDASWELDIFGGIRRGIEAAQADLESSEAGLEDTRVSLAAETASSYIEVRAYQTRLGIARDHLVSQSETLQLTDWRAQAGLVTVQDVEQARSNLEQTRAQIPTLESGLAQAEHRLDILLGKPPGTLHARLSPPGELPTVPKRIAVGIPADTLRRRPDVRAAERTLAAETARVGVAEAARYPSFTLSGSIGLEALTLGALGNSSAAASMLRAAVTGPIFDAGRLRSQVEIRDAIREQALTSYEKTLLSALQDVENALVALARNGERIEALEAAVQAARHAALLARHRYSVGLIDFQSVLDTERGVLSLQDSLAATQAESVSALIQLYKALGGGWSPQTDFHLTVEETS